MLNPISSTSFSDSENRNSSDPLSENSNIPFFASDGLRSLFDKGIGFLPSGLSRFRKSAPFGPLFNGSGPEGAVFLQETSDLFAGKIRAASSVFGFRWTKTIAFQMILVFLFEFAIVPFFEFSSLAADPFDLNFENRNKAKGRLESYYNAADKATDAAQWQNIVESGKRILSAEWEANANLEIEKELKKFTGTSAGREELRIQLQDQKRVVADRWEGDLENEMLEKRGVWKANRNKQDFESYFTTDKKKEIRTALENLVKAADAAKNATTGDANARLAAWDGAIQSGINGVRALWENNIVSIKGAILGSSAAVELTGSEKIEFEKKLNEIEAYYKNYFNLEENGIKLPARQSLVKSLNRDTDIAIAQEQDPTKLTELLIEKTKQQLDPASGQLLSNLDDFGELPSNYENVSGENPQEKILQALQNGQALWDEAIERLIVKKLEYDRQAEDKRIRNEDKWSKAYYALLDAKAKWTQDIDKQIQDGLKKWDESELKLKQNKEKALQELNQYLSVSQEQYVAHLSGMQGTILSSADTISSIVSNIAWYQDQIDKENKKSSPDAALINTYTVERNKWSTLQSQFRQYVASVQNKIHDEDVLGNNGGSGVLDDNGSSSDPYLFSSAEFEFRLAKAELAEIEKKKARAQAVVNYAEANVNVSNLATIQSELNTAKSAYESRQNAYLALLQQLNGTSPVVGGTTGTDPNSGSTTGNSTPPASTSLSELEAAKKLAEEKSAALAVAQSELAAARKRFDEAKQLQILALNNSSEMLGDIGSLNTDAATYDPNNPNGGIKFEIYQADLQIAEAREKLKENEKVYFSKNYNQTNAQRTEDFFGDLWNRIQSFETGKEKLKLLEDAVSDPGRTLLQKVNDLLRPDNIVLVSVFGNQGAAQVKAQLQSLTDALAKKVRDEQNGNVEKEKLPFAVEKFSASLDPLLVKSDDLLSQFDDTDKGQYQAFHSKMNDISSFLGSFSTTLNLNGSYLEMDDFNVWKSGLSDSLGKWGDQLSAFQSAKSDFSQALNVYRTYATAHPGAEASLEFQLEIQKVTVAFGKFQQKTSDLQAYWSDLSTRSSHIRLEALDRLQKARTLVDMSTLDMSTRTNLKSQIDSFKTSFTKKDATGKDIPDDISSLITGTGLSFSGAASVFSQYSSQYSNYRNTIDERSAILGGMSSILTQALESQRANVTAQKAQLGFLLDEDGDIEDLQNTVNGVEETAKTEAAKLDARVAEILFDKLGNLSSDSSERKFDPIYLGLSNEINELYSNFSGSADSILEIRARKIALAYLKNAAQSLSQTFMSDSEYSKFKADLAKMRDRAQDTLSFYEDDHGVLDEDDRFAFRLSDDDSERRKASEYFSFGSTFLFANQVFQETSVWLNLAGSMRGFSDAVKSGAILSGLRDDYFNAQESDASGLFQELISAAGVGSYSSVDFYKDSIRSQTGPDVVDSAKIAQKKAELAALLAGITDPQAQLAKLIQTGDLSSVFGLLTGTNVQQDLVAWQKEIADAKALFDNLDSNLQGPISNLSTQFDSLLNFFNSPAFAQMQSYANGIVASMDALKNLTDSNLPIYDPVADADGNSPYVGAPDQDGDPVGSPSWTPTFLDVNGKLPWEVGYRSDRLRISVAWTPTYRDANGKVPGDSGYNSGNLRILGYLKPLEDLDTSALSAKKDAFLSELAQLNTIKSNAQSKLATYRSSLNALSAFRAAHPADFATANNGQYLSLVQQLRTDGLALVGTHSATVSFLGNVSSKFQDLKSEQQFLTRLSKQALGLPIDKILVPQVAVGFTLPPMPADPLELSLTSALRSDISSGNPGNYSVVPTSARNIVQQVALLDFSNFKETSQFSDLGSNGAYFFSYNLSSANAGLSVAAQSVSLKADAWVNALQSKDAPVNALAGRLDDLNDRIVFYAAGSGPNQIGQNDLVAVVANMRDFLLQKSLEGVEFNPALKQMVEAAGAFTDEIENIQFLQQYPSTDKAVSFANLTATQEAQKTLTAVSSLATELSSFLSGNPPIFSNLGQVQALLEKYEILKNKPMNQAKFESEFRSKLGDAHWLNAFHVYRDKLAAAEAFFSPATQAKIDQLKENSWDLFKRNLANAYLSSRVGNPILTEFLDELRAGKFSVLVPNQGAVEIDSKFLGKAMSDAQILEVGEYLKPFDAMATVQRQGLVSDLNSFLLNFDPDLRDEMKSVSLVNQYATIRSQIAQGKVFSDRDLPAELKNFSLISSFEYFLANTKQEVTVLEGTTSVKRMVAKYDPSNADSRRAAMSDFLLKLGPVHKLDADGKLALDTTRQAEIEALTNGYLANYGTKNPSSYLNVQILKDFEARNAYYAEKELRISRNADPSTPADQREDELSYDDLSALKDWIVEAKFDPSTENAIVDAARMDFLLSHYLGEDKEDLSAEDLANNPELAKFYGTGGQGYFSQMDAYFAGKGLAVLSDAEKDRFRLLSSGTADAWGLWQYDPSGLISKDIFFQNFEYADEYKDLVGALGDESIRLKKELAQADREIRKEKYVYDYRSGLIKFNSYQSYLGVPTDNVASDVLTNESLAIQGRLRELEMDAEQKLGGLFNLLENHRSLVFDDTPLEDALPSDPIQTKADLNPGLRTAAKVMSSSYSLNDGVSARDASGNFSFEGDFVNLKARLDQALNVVSPGSVDFDKYADTINSQSGLMNTLKNTIKTAGQSYAVLKGMLANGVNPQAELNAATAAFNAANALIEGPTGLKKQFEDAQAAVTQKQSAYLNKQQEVSDAYNLMLSAQDAFNQKAALYDYATLLEYSKHNTFQADNNASADDSGIPAGYIDTPKKLALDRLAAVQKEFDEKQLQVAALEKKMAEQIGVADLSAYVQSEKQEAEKWALLAVKFNTAESLLRQKIADLKRQIGNQQARFDQEMDKLYGIAPPFSKQSVGMLDSLEGSLNFDGASYLKAEQWNRDRTRMAEGFLSDRIGTMDVLTAYQWDYAQGLNSDMQPFNLNAFTNRWGDVLNNASFTSLPKRANDHMNSILFPAPETRGFRSGAGGGPGSAGAYENAYGVALNVQTMGQVFFLQQLDLVCMGMCLLTFTYLNEINTYNNNKNQVNAAVGSVKAEAASLKSLYSQLQELTDVDDTNQLLSVLGRPEFGLTSADLAMIGRSNPASNNLKDLVWRSSADTQTPLSFNDLTGSDGLRLAQQKAIHDEYGNYVRGGEYTAGGATAVTEKTDQYGRQTALMVGADEFLDALGVLAEAQYHSARDAYYTKAEGFVKQVGTGADKVAVKVDVKTVLQDRELFTSDLMKKITRTTNGETVALNVETTIYKSVLNDYLGESGVVSQIFNAELQQRAEQQKLQWDLKEKEFYDLKGDWIQNVSYLKQTGAKRWENMVQEFQAKWTDWRADYKAEHEANQAVFLDRIESAVVKKETWTKDFLQKSSDQADELSLRQMYDSIAGVVSAMQENLPQGVNVNVNVNDILSNILSKQPGSISASLIDRAASIDTNFFLNEVKKYNFNDSGVKEKFKSMMQDMDKLSQNLIILQTLESLRSLPQLFADTIKTQNATTDQQLDSTMAYGGFARVGAMYVRTIKTASGGDEVQSLATYVPFFYDPPTKFPTVKDSNGTVWDMGKPDALINGDKVPSPSDLTVMVRLAKNQMGADFKKVFNPAKEHNYEAELGLFNPADAMDAYNDFVEGVTSGDSVSCMNKKAEDCAKSAITSGLLVGEVPDGSYGVAQFGQFYAILSAKKEMDKRKGKMDAARKRKSGGMGRFYNQLGTIGEGLGEAVKGFGQMVVSGAKAYHEMMIGNFNSAKSDLKAAGKAGERGLQGAMYAVSGVLDFVAFAVETVAEAGLAYFSSGILNMQNTGLDGKFAEANYELDKLKNRNKSQEQLNQLGVRTGAEMYANDAMLDKVVSTTLAVTGIIGTILSFVPFPPVAAAGATMAIGSAIGMAAWKSFRGTYEGGAAGAMAGVASAGINYALDKASLGAVNVNLSYSYAGGFGVGVNVGEGLAAGVSYNEKSGFGVSAGIAANGVSLMYTENFGKGDVRASHGWQAQVGGLEVSYDNLSGYSASFQAASAMFGDTNLKMTSSLTWSEQNGFNGSISYNLLTKEQMAKEAAKNAQKNTQQNQGNLFLNIMDGLGYNLGGREGEPTLWDNIQGAFSGAWHQLTNPLETLGNIGNGFSKLGKGLAGLASGAWDGISGLFGGNGAGLSPAEIALLKREKDFQDYADAFMEYGDEIAGPYGRQRDKQLQSAYDKIHTELFPQTEDGPGSYVMDGFIKPFVDAMKKMLSPGVKTGIEAMEDVQKISGKIGDVREALQITKPIVEDTIQLIYREMDAAREQWKNDDQAIYDQISDLQNGEQNPNTTDKIQDLMNEQKNLKTKLTGRLDSLDSEVGQLITLANNLNAGTTTNLNGAYAQIYSGLQRVNSPELSTKSSAILNVAGAAQNFLIGYFNYKVTGMAATRNEMGTAWSYKGYEDQQRDVLRKLWTNYMKQSNANDRTRYMNSTGF
uniref:Uncharacterized protein n=1 Tax=Leptospira ellisii TaxID=2023197 RepID=A0A2N0BBT8_9LEPT|nr:hypothetical protein [Leptospira ellisii]PJZ93984.1 hypothetical protein CH379_05010 [Leptospira ellisii]